MQSNSADIELAGSLLEVEGWNLVIVRDGEVLLRSREHGVAAFFRAVKSSGAILHNAAVADRMVGSAVAMLCLHAGVTSVYAVTASLGALEILKSQGLPVTSRHTVPHILNSAETDLCPFERLAQESEDPAQLLSAMEPMFGGY